jgi:hypothetical protein
MSIHKTINVPVVVFIIVAIKLSVFAAEPSIDGTAGNISYGNTVTVSGSNFDSVFRGSVADEYFDDRSSGFTTATDGVAMSDSGTILTTFLTADIDNATPGGNFHQLEHLGWLAKIDNDAANYSTGYGYRRPTAHYDPSQYITSGENHGISYNWASGTGPNEVWVSWAFRPNSSGNDSTTNYPDSSNTDSWMLKFLWPFLNNDSSNGQLLHIDSQNWNAGSNCGNKTKYRVQGNGPNYPVWNSIKHADASCSDYNIPDNNKWAWVKVHIDFNTGSGDGVMEVWADGVQIVEQTTLSYGDTKLGRMKFGGNNSGRNDGSFFTPNNNENMTFDYDDVVISSTEPKAPACVYLSNKATWGSGVTDRWNGDANFVRQKVGGSAAADYGFKSWSDIQMKFEVNLGTLDIYQPVYLYVTNWDGETNANGIHLTEGLPPAPPSNLEIQ